MDQRDVFARPQLRKRAPFVLRGQQVLFLAATLVFIATGGTWLGVYFYSGRLLNINADLRSQISSLEEDLDPNLIKELVNISNGLASARTLIKNHLLTSNVFEFLEKNTHPKVAYGSISYSAGSRKMDLSATAASYLVLARQINVFESSPVVNKVSFGGLSIKEDRSVGFSLGIEFKPELIRVR